jgi:hypothetical protein
MTPEQYKEKLKEIQEKHKKELFQLDKEYALLNNTYKIGDIIEDHQGKIKIEKFLIYKGYNNNLPICVYLGVELKKDETPTKKGDKRQVWQSNLLKK